MPDLTSAQRKHLRRLAHPLDPVAKIGKGGLTDAVERAVDKALDDHELIKVKFVDFKDQKKELSAQLAQRTQSHQAGLIGNIVILYRQNPDPEKRAIALP